MMLVRQARAVEDSIDPFEANEGRYTFRLNIPMLAVREGVAKGVRLETDEFVLRQEALWHGPRLEAYCRSAIGLVRLLIAIDGSEERNELSDAVTIANKSHKFHVRNSAFHCGGAILLYVD